MKNRLILAVLFFLSACNFGSPPETRTSPTSLPQSPKPTAPSVAQPINYTDIIFHNGAILTMNRNQPTAEAILIRGEKIEAVGSNADILALRGNTTLVIDLGGLTLLPGFVDTHSHIVNASDGDVNLFSDMQATVIQGGLTTTTEMGVTPEILDQLKGYDQAGKVQLRFNTYLLYNTNCGEIFDTNWYKTYKQGENITPRIRNQGVKIFSDGGSCNVPAVTFDYPGGYGKGDLYMTQDEMNRIVAQAQADGYQVAVHALGDAAIEQVQNAIAAALNGAPNTYRHRIEHNAALHDALLPRYNEIGIVPTIFGAYPTCWRINKTNQFKYTVPENLGTWEWAWRALLDANPGLIAAWHADYSSFPITNDPIAHLYGFVTRNEVAPDGSVCQAPDWLKQGAITVDEALHAMTINAAYALFREDEIGSLEAGKLADLIILSQNPLQVEPEAIKDTDVLMTMISGKVEHCAPGRESLCPPASSADLEPAATSPAFSSAIIASAELPDSPASNAIDRNTETIWNSGSDPEQWIMLNLGAPKNLSAIHLTVSQFPAGETVHQIWVGADPNNLILVHEFKGFTNDSDVLDFVPSAPLTNVQYIKIVTTQSPSWVAWREIEVISQ